MRMVTRIYIDGEFVTPHSTEMLYLFDPVRGEVRGGLSRNPRKFRHSKSCPAKSASRSIILPPLWNV